MRIAYTKHAQRRMKQRGIHSVHVIQTIMSPDETQIQSNKIIAKKQIANQTLIVVYRKEKNIKVITTYFQ